jgi:hypothetical protein
MKKLLLTILVVGLSACNGPDTSSVGGSTQSVSTTASAPTAGTASTSSVTKTLPTSYLYILVGGKIVNYPIDPDTGALIQRDNGYTISSVSVSFPTFYGIMIHPNGKFMYATDKVNNKYYLFSITDLPYEQYMSQTPVTYVSNAGGGASDMMAIGNNGNFFFRSNTTFALQFSVNSSTGVLTTIGSQVSASTAQSTYGFTFSHTTSVSSGIHTYTIDSQTNTVIHYVNGVIDGSTQTVESGTITSLAIR